MAEIVVVESLVKVYGDKARVGPVSLTVKDGEVYGLVGPNGSGKTTTMRAVPGLLRLSAGSITVFGFDPFTQPEKVNQLVGYSPEIPSFPQFFTAEKLLRTTCRLKGLSNQETEQEIKRILELTGLVNHADRRIGNFSKGMVQRLSIGQALVGNPSLLVLDEPMLGVDPVGRAHIRDILKDLRREGRTILYSSHELYEVEKLSDRIGMIYMGRTLFEEDIRNLLSVNVLKRVVDVELARPADQALIGKILTLDGVEEVSMCENRLTIHLDGRGDPREEIAQTIVSHGYGLLEMKLGKPSLEDIFIGKVRENVGV
jgi:ABC-2 type transport system ATP-binding protein